MNRVRESNNLQIWGNKESMNLNSMILTNIQSSTYFKTKLFDLKTYHEVIDEIYYRVNHLEPWEKGSRRTQGLTGMCGGVRGVGGGGIVSTAFCLLYKLYTLKLTRKQVVGLFTHQDSPYIRALGFMYVRYTQNPQDLLNWYYDYLDDEEEVDVRAGGGLTITIGQMLRQWLTRLEWFDTLFPRIPVPIQKEIFDALRDRYGNRIETAAFYEPIGGGQMSGAVGRDMSSKTTSKRSPPPEIAEIIKHTRSSRSESHGRSNSRGRRRSKTKSRSRSTSRTRRRSRSNTKSRSRSASRGMKRKTDESEKSKNKKRHHRSRSRSSTGSESSNDKKERHRHRHHHHKKRSDKDEDRHRHRHHRKHRDDDDDEKEKRRREEKHSRDKDSKSRKDSKKSDDNESS